MQTVKIINFGELVNSHSENTNEGLEDLDEIQDLDDMGDLDSESESESESDNNSNSNNECDEVKEELAENVTQEKLNFIKSIDISNLEEHAESGNVDYKKMSMAKLKSIAVARGLIQDNSKATKNAILKMLSSE